MRDIFGGEVSAEEIYREDMDVICHADFIPWNELKEAALLITGATGLIGSTLIRALLYANEKRQLNLKIYALVRDLDRAKVRFANCLKENVLIFCEGTVEELPAISEPIDYIVHGASQTASMQFVEKPVETILTTVQGTEHVLKAAKEKNVRGFVYLSSMEVYGHPTKGHKVTETEVGALSSLDVRSSYPLSKLQSENLCCAYEKEYQVPAMILRLTQTYGSDVNYSDGRIFAYFGQCVRERKDIVLKTTGESERSYLYAGDAVTAILTVLLKGVPGRAYNAADESSYCSIAEMAQRIAERYGLNLVYDISNPGAEGYPEAVYMNLDTSLLRKLGWNVLLGE